jgi:GH24 family phage-related lysozyme (muramidase)
MDDNAFTEQLQTQEGLKLTVSPDTATADSVGYGHDILPEDNLHRGNTITIDTANALLEHDKAKAISDCENLYPGFDSFPDSAQLALATLVFNIGAARIPGYATTNAFVYKQDWKGLADYLSGPDWATWRSQVDAACSNGIIGNLYDAGGNPLSMQKLTFHVLSGKAWVVLGVCATVILAGTVWVKTKGFKRKLF